MPLPAPCAAGVKARAPLPSRRAAARHSPSRRGLRRLGPALSSRKPFSSSALGAKSATPSKICARARSSSRRRRPSAHARRPATRAPPFGGRQGVGGSCSALHFQRARVWQVSCDTLLPGCRPPWPPPCCPDPRPAFLALRLPAAPYPCARFFPLRAPCLPGDAHGARRCARVCSSRPPSSALPRATRARPLSCGTFRREPATRRFDGSFAATPSSRDRFARQAPSEPQAGLPPPSLSPGVVHRLSGRCARALCLPGAPRPPRSVLRTFRSRARSAPWSVFQDGPRTASAAARASRRLFRAFSLRSRASFLLSLAVLLLYRPTPLFSLRWIAPPFTVQARAQLLRAPRARTGLPPSLAGASPLFPLAAAHPVRFAAGSSPFARRYSGNPSSFLFLRVLICLSPAGRPTRNVRSGAAAPAAARPLACAAPFLAWIA